MKNTKILILLLFILLASFFFEVNKESKTDNPVPAKSLLAEDNTYNIESSQSRTVDSKIKNKIPVTTFADDNIQNETSDLSEVQPPVDEFNSLSAGGNSNALFPSINYDGQNSAAFDSDSTRTVLPCACFVTFLPASTTGNMCCYALSVSCRTAFDAFYIDVAHLSVSAMPQQIPGWTPTVAMGTNTDRILWTKNSGTVSGVINFGTICFNTTVLNWQQITYSITNSTGTVTPCLGSYTLEPCNSSSSVCNFKLGPSRYACMPTLQSGPNYSYNFAIEIQGPLSADIINVIPSIGTLGNPSPPFPFNYPGGGGVRLFSGNLVMPQNGGNVTFSVIFRLSNGDTCHKLITYNLPQCSAPLPCDCRIGFIPTGNPNVKCCFKVKIQCQNGINAFYVDVAHLSIYGIPYGSSPNTPLGWTRTLTQLNSTTDRIKWTLNSGTTNNADLGIICFDRTVLNWQQVTYGVSNNGGASWFCNNTYSLPPCAPPPDPCDFTVRDSVIKCDPLNQSGPSYTYNFWLTIQSSFAATIFNITSSSGTITNPTVPPIPITYGGGMSSLAVNGELVIPQTGGTVTFTVWFSFNGTRCSRDVTITLPECPNNPCEYGLTPIGIECNTVLSNAPDYVYDFAFAINGAFPASVVSITPNLGTLTHISPNVVPFPFTTGPQTYVGRLAIPQSGGTVTFTVVFDMDGVICQREVTFTLPSCGSELVCAMNIWMQTHNICDGESRWIHAAQYNGPATYINWYVATSNPGTNTNPATSPWNPNPNFDGTDINAGPLYCNPPGEITRYWYMAVLTDPNCPGTPFSSNIDYIDVYPVLELSVTGTMELCTGPNGASTTLTLNGMGTNNTCSIVWTDLQTNTTVTPVSSTYGRQIYLQGLTASLADCPFRVYNYSVKVCDGICNPTVPVTIKVYSNSKATSIIADRYDICWGEDTQLHIVDDNYCGDIQWQLNCQYGTGGVWVDIPGANNTLNWNTDRLIEDTHYRVKFKNGVCGEVYSEPITVFVHRKVEAVISYHATTGGLCPGLLCPSVQFDLNINPATATWQWCMNGVPIPGTNQLMTYTTTVAGSYSVCVTDPYCGDVSSNVLPAYPFSATLTGPSCVCFTPTLLVDLTVTPVCPGYGPFSVALLRNGSPIYSQIRTADANGNIIIPNIHISPGENYVVEIKGPCIRNPIRTNFYYPTGCDCPR